MLHLRQYADLEEGDRTMVITLNHVTLNMDTSTSTGTIIYRLTSLRASSLSFRPICRSEKCVEVGGMDIHSTNHNYTLGTMAIGRKGQKMEEEGRREGAHLRYPDLLDDIVLPILFLPNKEGPAI